MNNETSRGRKRRRVATLPPHTKPHGCHGERPSVRNWLVRWIVKMRGRIGVPSPVVSRKVIPLGAALALVLALAPATARAVELYSDPCCSTAPQPVWVEPAPVVYVQPQPVVHVSPEPVVVVQEVVVSEPAVVVAQEPREPVLTWVEATGGAGMWIIPGLEEDVHLGYNAKAQLALRGFFMGLDFTWIHGMHWKPEDSGEDCVEAGNLALIAMAFGYRFNPDGRVHPELGVSFDTLVLDREEASTRLGFGIGGKGGLVVDFPLSYGAIVTSIEVSGHRHLWSQNGFYPPRSTVSVVGTIGFRFN